MGGPSQPAAKRSSLSPCEGEEEEESPRNLPLAPEVLRCTRSGSIKSRCSIEEASEEARQAHSRFQLLQTLQGMTAQQRLSCCLRFREKGNKHFAAREYTEAISCYERGLLAVDRVAFTDDNEETAKKQQLLPLLLNLSACLLQLRQFARTKALCDIALKIDPQSCKALYRRATASKELGDLRGAQRDFRYILKICELQQQKQQQQQQQVEPHKAKEQRREGSPNKDLHPAAAAEEELQQVQRSLTAIPKDNQSAAASPASLQQDACGSPAAAAAAAGGWCLSQTARQQLVLQCRRQLASVSRQQQQYTAACARMFSVQQQQQQQQQQGRRQQLAGRPLGEEGGRLLSYACLYAWRRWMDFCCLCKQRKQRTPCSSS